MDQYSVASKDEINRKFDEIEDILDCLGPIQRFPDSLLKARIDALSLVLLIELELGEACHAKKVLPESVHATQ